MREVHHSDHFIIEVDEASRLVRRTRTAQRFVDVAEIELAYEAASRATHEVAGTEHVLLVDLRLAPPRNDPAYEGVVSRFMEALFGGFRRVAVLTKTEVGKLQVSRLVPTHYPNARVFTDEEEALAYLSS